MATSKQLYIYILLLGTYTCSSICIAKNAHFDTLPHELQEYIIELLPANNLYRALWSRCHNASQKFYDDYVQAYVASHFVPQEFIDKAIAKDFAYFHGSPKQKQEFQEKIKRALQCY